MKDKYQNFQQLLLFEREGHDFRSVLRQANSGCLIIAPHGGGIERGTSELANAIAGKDHSLYVFEGIKRTNNRSLHITSTHFDDPELLKLLNVSSAVIAIHGCDGDEEVACIGGRDHFMRDQLITRLSAAGIKADMSKDMLLQGEDENNICNKNETGKGVQIELSEGLRRTMFVSLTREGRKVTKKPFTLFVKSVSSVIQNTGKR